MAPEKLLENEPSRPSYWVYSIKGGDDAIENPRDEPIENPDSTGIDVPNQHQNILLWNAGAPSYTDAPPAAAVGYEDEWIIEDGTEPLSEWITYKTRIQMNQIGPTKTHRCPGRIFPATTTFLT